MEFSIVTSIYRDGYLAHDFCAALAKTFSLYFGKSEVDLVDLIEVIFVNDGSPDDSLEQLLKTKEQFKFVKIVDLSRNFGQHEALACGYRMASGHYVIRSNVDLQESPSEILKLVNEMMSGNYDLVVGQYRKRNSPLINKLTAFLYFKLFKFLTGLEVPQRTSPARVMNRTFIDAYNNLSEKSRFPQGLDQWLGFRHKYVEIEHQSRIDGRSSYNLWSRSTLALTGILYFTDRPLKLIGYFGLIMAMLGLLLAGLIIAAKITGNSLLPGYASLASIALIGFGFQIGSIGLVGLYVGRIFREAQNRPLYIIREVF